MLVEGVDIKGFVMMGDMLMLPHRTLEDFAQRCKEHGAREALEEREKEEAVLWGRELAEYLRIGYTTLQRYRKNPIHKRHGMMRFLDNPIRIGMRLKDAEELRDRMLGIT